MPITQDRMIRLINACRAYEQRDNQVQTLINALRRAQIASAIDLYQKDERTNDDIDNAIALLVEAFDQLAEHCIKPINRDLTRAVDWETSHFQQRAKSNNSARAYQRRRRNSTANALEQPDWEPN